ncbi:MAG: hypothetical protein KF678_15540 [Phycisphaeraceae bacterium]|nr:hypothetical protein [Phycisphaeraceae bacterium]
MQSEHNGRPMEEILADVIIKHALSGKFPYLKEIFDRLEGKPTETVHARVESRTVTIYVPPPRIINETDEEYRARLALENQARDRREDGRGDHQRMLGGRGEEGV